MDRPKHEVNDISRRQRVVLALLGGVIVLTVFGLMLPWSPIFKGLGADSGLFAYTGEQILSGQLLYRDVWDNKPPGVYYVNAFAISVVGDTPWAIWWLQIVWLSTTTLALFFILRKLTGTGSGFLTSLLFLFTVMYPDYFQGGNFTEVYALLPQVLIVGTMTAYFLSGKAKWLVFTGFLTSLALLFKPTYIALGMATLIVILYSDLQLGNKRKAMQHLLLFGIGAIIPLGIVLSYWGYRGALEEFTFAVFIYNRQYVQEQLSLQSLYGTARNYLIVQPMATVFAFTMVAAVLFFQKNLNYLSPRPSKTSIDPENAYLPIREALHPYQRWVFFAGFLAIPIEILFVSISGRNFGHYFITPMPAMATVLAYLFMELGRLIRSWREFGHWPVVLLFLLAVMGAGWFLEVMVKEVPERDHLKSINQLTLTGNYIFDELEQYIVDHSDPDQSVLVWGIRPGINFVTRRRFPSRYPFVMHLTTPSGEGKSRFDVFLEDVYDDPPALVLAQPSSSAGILFFGVEEPYLCPGCPPEAQRGMQDLKAYVEKNYTLIEQIWDWNIYRRNKN